MKNDSMFTKKEEIMIEKIKDAFNSYENRVIPFEVISNSIDPIMLSSPVINSKVNFNVTINASIKNNIISGSIVKIQKFDEGDIETLIEFANRMNKNFGSVSYLSFDPVEKILIMRFAVELVDGKLNTDRLLSCFDIAFSNAINNFRFLENTDISGCDSGELFLKYINFRNNLDKFNNRESN
jgi:hypothetical protein